MSIADDLLFVKMAF